MSGLAVVLTLLLASSFVAPRSKNLRMRVDPDKAVTLAEGFFGGRRLPEGANSYNERGWPSFERRMNALSDNAPTELVFKQVQLCIQTQTADPLSTEESPLVDKIDEFIQASKFVSFDDYIELSDGSYLSAMYDCCLKVSVKPARCVQNTFETLLKKRLQYLVEEIVLIMQRKYEDPFDLVPEIDKYLGLNPLISFGTDLKRYGGETASFNGHFFFMLKESCDSEIVLKQLGARECLQENLTLHECLQTLQQCLLEGVEMWLEVRRRAFVDGVVKTITRYGIVKRAVKTIDDAIADGRIELD